MTAIFHQVRASTTPAFNVNSNTQTFGGNTGSAQAMWTLSGLGSGTWYFQFRSSYDGVNFNTWKNANSGSAVGGLVSQVTTETAAYSDWALFSLPGSEIMGVCEGLLQDQELLGIPSGYNLYSSGLVAIAGPNGFPAQSNGISGMTLSDVDLVIPPGSVTSGIPDYPVEIRSQMAQADTSILVPSTASVFGIAFNPAGNNVTLYEQPGGSTTWAVFTLPGGAQFAVGQGKGLDGTAIWGPPVPWFQAANMMSICSLTDTPLDQAPVTGFGQCQLSGLNLEGNYLHDDGSLGAAGVQSVNWLAIAWQQGANVQTVGGFPFLTIPLQGGHEVVFGAGQVASGGGPVSLPAGFNESQMLSLCTPGGSDNSGNHMRGVLQCAFDGLSPVLTYTDNANYWSGAVNFMLCAWQ